MSKLKHEKEFLRKLAGYRRAYANTLVKEMYDGYGSMTANHFEEAIMNLLECAASGTNPYEEEL